MRYYYETPFFCSFEPILGGICKTTPSPSDLRVAAEAERMKIVRAEIQREMGILGQLLQVVRPDCGPLVPLKIVK